MILLHDFTVCVHVSMHALFVTICAHDAYVSLSKFRLNAGS